MLRCIASLLTVKKNKCIRPSALQHGVSLTYGKSG
jgi:hypothetical protein